MKQLSKGIRKKGIKEWNDSLPLSQQSIKMVCKHEVTHMWKELSGKVSHECGCRTVKLRLV